MKQKKKVRILKLEGCGGCIQRLFSSPNLLEIMNNMDFTESNLSNEKMDFLLVEGFAVNPEQNKLLKEASENAKSTILFGSCAISPKIMIGSSDSANASIFTKVKSELPGCPPSYEAINELISCLSAEKSFGKINAPVCDSCIKSEIKCLLLKGIDCQGADTKGDCKILCMKIGKGCDGCRTKMGNEK